MMKSFSGDEATHLLRNVVSNIDLLIVQKHTVDGLDGSLGSFSSLVVNEAIALGTTLLVGSNLARKNVTESSEGIVEGLVVNRFVQVLDEDVALAGLAESGVTLGPHDAATKHSDLANFTPGQSTYHARPLIKE